MGKIIEVYDRDGRVILNNEGAQLMAEEINVPELMRAVLA
tara:strand:+ start:607 stop:726 length:120 start_codon:yes stop_codon:yes gene_type:complete